MNALVKLVLDWVLKTSFKGVSYGMLSVSHWYAVNKANVLLAEREKETFPWWERLHGFWRTLPNFNPYTVTSGHGQDIAMDAQDMFFASKSDTKTPGSDDDDAPSQVSNEQELEQEEPKDTQLEDVRILCPISCA